MKAKSLFITHSCIGKGGDVLEAGTVIDNVTDERYAYDLIASSRAVDLDTREGKELLAEHKKAQEEKSSKPKK